MDSLNKSKDLGLKYKIPYFMWNLIYNNVVGPSFYIFMLILDYGIQLVFLLSVYDSQGCLGNDQ